MGKIKVEDAGDLRKYRIEIPNIIDDLELGPHTVRLYVHLKRVAGPDGECWQSTRTIADHCKMSTGQVSKSKQILQDNGLITITEVKHEKPGSPYHLITIVDIWLRNFQKFSQGSQSERQGSQGETKNKPFKKQLKEEEKEKEEIPFDDFEGHPDSIKNRPEAPISKGYKPSVADPSQDPPEVEELARQLAPPIDLIWGYDKATDKKLLHAARELLKRCKGGNIDDVLEALDTYLEKNGDWARENIEAPMGLVSLVARTFQKMQIAGQRQAAAGTSWAEHAELSQQALAERQAEAVEAEEQDPLWERALGALRLQMTGETFNTWFKPTRLLSRNNGAITVGVANEYAKDWLENRLLSMIKRTLAECGVQNAEVKFEVMQEDRND